MFVWQVQEAVKQSGPPIERALRLPIGFRDVWEYLGYRCSSSYAFYLYSSDVVEPCPHERVYVYYPILVEANWVWRHLQQIGHWPYFHIYFGCGMLDIPLYPTTKPHSGLPIPTSYFSDIILNSRAANVIYHGFANLAACFPLVGRSNEDRDGAAKTKSDCQFRLVGPPIWSIEGCEGHTALSTPGTVQVLGYNMNICYIVCIYIYVYIYIRI